MLVQFWKNLFWSASCFCFSDFQNYLRTQTGSTTTINIIICTVDYLLRLQVTDRNSDITPTDSFFSLLLSNVNYIGLQIFRIFKLPTGVDTNSKYKTSGNDISNGDRAILQVQISYLTLFVL